MKSFIIKILVFAVLMLAVDMSIGKVFEILQERAPYGNWQRFRYINDEMKDEILIMGSSRASHHYVPKIIEDSLGMSCYNCGVDGYGIIMFWGNYQMFSSRYSPKMIIYDLSRFDTAEDDHSTYLGWLRAYYDRDCIPRMFDEVDEMEKYKMMSHAYRWNFKFVQLATDNVAQFVKTEKGYKPLSGTMNYVPGKDKNNLITNKTIKADYDELKFEYIERMIVSCKKRGITLVFALSPMYGAGSSGVYEGVFALAKKYDCPVIDMYASQKYVSDTRYFKDSSHMNSFGAEEYTKDFILNLKKLGLV